MNNTGSSTEQSSSATHIDLEYILRELQSLSDCMDQLAGQTRLRQCDLIVCVGQPDKLGHLKILEAPQQAPQAFPGNNLEGQP